MFPFYPVSLLREKLKNNNNKNVYFSSSSRISIRGFTRNVVLFQKPLGPGQSSQQGSPDAAHRSGQRHVDTNPPNLGPVNALASNPPARSFPLRRTGSFPAKFRSWWPKRVPRGTAEEPAGVRSRRRAPASRPAAPGERRLAGGDGDGRGTRGCG